MTTIPDEVFAAFAEMCGSDTAEAFGHLTCREADIIARLLVAGGEADAAAWMLIGHAGADAEQDDLHADLAFTGNEAGITVDQRVRLAVDYVREVLA